MNLKNSVLLIGHLGKDPEFLKLDSGRMRTRINLATNEKYRDPDGNLIQKTEWHQCIAWGKKAELMCKLLCRGKEVMVRGKLTYRNYVDKEGHKRIATEIVVNDFMVLSKKVEEVPVEERI